MSSPELERQQLNALDRAILATARLDTGRHPMVDVHFAVAKAIADPEAPHGDRTEILRLICERSIRLGYVVAF